VVFELFFLGPVHLRRPIEGAPCKETNKRQRKGHMKYFVFTEPLFSAPDEIDRYKKGPRNTLTYQKNLNIS
jgi:hypothetical protein